MVGGAYACSVDGKPGFEGCFLGRDATPETQGHRRAEKQNPTKSGKLYFNRQLGSLTSLHKLLNRIGFVDELRLSIEQNESIAVKP